jgi:hypothetical protein
MKDYLGVAITVGATVIYAMMGETRSIRMGTIKELAEPYVILSSLSTGAKATRAYDEVVVHAVKQHEPTL